MNGSGQLRWASALNNAGETEKAQNFSYHNQKLKASGFISIAKFLHDI